MATSLEDLGFTIGGAGGAGTSTGGNAKSPAQTDPAVEEAYQRFMSSIGTSITDLAQSISIGKGAVQQQQTAIKDQAEAEMSINVIKEQAAIKRETANARARAALGTDPDATSYVVEQFGRKTLADEEDIQRRNTEIQKKMDQGFLDDPFQWIINQVEIPFNIESYNNRVEGQQQTQKTLQELLSRTTEAAQVNSTIDYAAGETRLAAVNKLVAAKAAEDLAKSNMELAKLGITGVTARTALNKDLWGAVVERNGIEVRTQTLELQRNADARATEQAGYLQEIRQQNLEEKLDKVAEQKILQTKLDKATDALSMSRIGVKELGNYSGKLKDLLERAMNDPAVQVYGRMPGANTAEILDNMNALNVPGTPGMNIVRKKLIGTKDALIKQEQQLWKTYGPDVQNTKLQAAYEATTQRELTSIPATGGIYSPAPLSKLVTIPAVAATSLGQSMKVIGEAEPQHNTDPTEVIKFALSKINDGSALPAQMADEIKTIFTAAGIENNEVRQYRRFALPMMDPSTTGFNMQVYTGLGWDSSEVIDMTNKSKLESVLTRMVIQQKRAADMAKETEDARKGGPGARAVEGIKNAFGAKPSETP